jgi:hypothetical protein
MSEFLLSKNSEKEIPQKSFSDFSSILPYMDTIIQESHREKCEFTQEIIKK